MTSDPWSFLSHRTVLRSRPIFLWDASLTLWGWLWFSAGLVFGLSRAGLGGCWVRLWWALVGAWLGVLAAFGGLALYFGCFLGGQQCVWDVTFPFPCLSKNPKSKPKQITLLVCSHDSSLFSSKHQHHHIVTYSAIITTTTTFNHILPCTSNRLSDDI